MLCGVRRCWAEVGWCCVWYEGVGLRLAGVVCGTKVLGWGKLVLCVVLMCWAGVGWCCVWY